MSLTGDLGARCMLWKGAPGTGGSGILCLSLSLLFPLFSSRSLPPLLLVATISLSSSFSLAFTFPFSLSHSRFVCRTQCSVLSPTFSFFSHTLTSCVYSFLSQPSLLSLSHTFPFSHTFLFSPTQFLFPLHALLFSTSVSLSPSPPTFNLFPHVLAFSRTHTLFLSLSPPHTLFLSATYLLSPTVLLLLFNTLKISLLLMLTDFPL